MDKRLSVNDFELISYATSEKVKFFKSFYKKRVLKLFFLIINPKV